jgi:hypothetical protein
MANINIEIKLAITLSYPDETSVLEPLRALLSIGKKKPRCTFLSVN